MNPLCAQKKLSSLEARLKETEARIAAQKKHLGVLEDKGINASQACQSLALTTNYLKILKVRSEALREKLSLADAASQSDH